MSSTKPAAALAAFKSTFRDLASYKHRFEVFRDFVTLAACSLHNSLWVEQGREEEYLRIIGEYKADDQKAFPKLLAHLVEALDDEPRDILGPLYMELEIANKDAGQFFTPPEISEVMAQMIFGSEIEKLSCQDYITASEPACGAGGMILALVKTMRSHGHDPASKLWVQCIDVDRMAALMCYIQLTLWHVPAEVIVGNTLSWELREKWLTPAHHLGLWSSRLRSGQVPEPAVEVRDEVVEAELAREHRYECFPIEWKGQQLLIRWCPDWSPNLTGHLEISSEDRSPHPISETGYRSHFLPRQQVEEMGGPTAYVLAWLEERDDGKAVQLALF